MLVHAILVKPRLL